jgi:hypothetical protein
MLEECKSLNHTYLVGDQVFDLPSQQMVTIQKIELMKHDAPGSFSTHGEERQSVNPTSDAIVSPDPDFFLVTVDAPAVEGYGEGRLVYEFCLPEEAERYRGWTEIH